MAGRGVFQKFQRPGQRVAGDGRLQQARIFLVQKVQERLVIQGRRAIGFRPVGESDQADQVRRPAGKGDTVLASAACHKEMDDLLGGFQPRHETIAPAEILLLHAVADVRDQDDADALAGHAAIRVRPARTGTSDDEAKEPLGMAEEPAEARRARGQALLDVTKEDLELFATDELEERIALLEGEIARVRGQIGKKQSSRAAADALFTKRN